MAYQPHINLRHALWNVETYRDTMERNQRYKAAWDYAVRLGRQDAARGRKPTQNPFTCLCDRAAWMEGFYNVVSPPIHHPRNLPVDTSRTSTVGNVDTLF